MFIDFRPGNSDLLNIPDESESKQVVSWESNSYAWEYVWFNLKKLIAVSRYSFELYMWLHNADLKKFWILKNAIICETFISYKSKFV